MSEHDKDTAKAVLKIKLFMLAVCLFLKDVLNWIAKAIVVAIAAIVVAIAVGMVYQVNNSGSVDIGVSVVRTMQVSP